MTILEIARRLDATARGGRWFARCPAHDDRQPSLSLREGSDGKTLLHCFAGCAPAAIVEALGLGVADLFADARPANRLPSRSPIERAQEALDDELTALLDREEQRLGFRPPPLTRFRNEARAAVERRFDVRLSRHAVPWWEVTPHDVDPEWQACIDRAIEEFVFEQGSTVECTREELAKLPQLQDDVLWRARALQSELADCV